MNKATYYFFSFLSVLLLGLIIEVAYIYKYKSYSTHEIVQKEQLLKIARVSNLNSAVKDNLVEAYR